MAKKALINKAAGKPKYKVRAYTRCRRCGRARSVFRKFGVHSQSDLLMKLRSESQEVQSA